MAAVIEGDTLVKRFGMQMYRPGDSMIRFSLKDVLRLFQGPFYAHDERISGTSVERKS